MAEKMLPPFRISNLNDGSTNANAGGLEKIVRITAPRYDAAVSTTPEASLRYNDEDGDVVTVCSLITRM